MSVGYKDDPIFLLSIQEYEYYKDEIPPYDNYCWLRSPGIRSARVACADDGYVDTDGDIIQNSGNCARPALKYDSDEDTIIFGGADFIKIDDNLFFAKKPIDFARFDKKSNDYETSEIRQYLLDWYEKNIEEKSTELNTNNIKQYKGQKFWESYQLNESLSSKVGYKDDPIFLLSEDEYETYKDVIHKCNDTGWWLRTPSKLYEGCELAVKDAVAFCRVDDCPILIDSVGVRPALKYKSTKNVIRIETFLNISIYFIKIDDGLYISEEPINYREFDKCSNNYETSETRKWLLNWYNKYVYKEEESTEFNSDNLKQYKGNKFWESYKMKKNLHLNEDLFTDEFEDISTELPETDIEITQSTMIIDGIQNLYNEIQYFTALNGIVDDSTNEVLSQVVSDLSNCIGKLQAEVEKINTPMLNIENGVEENELITTP